MVVATAKMIARPNATENAAKIKRGAITCSLLDHLNCTNLPRSIWFRPPPGEIGAVENVLMPFVSFHDGGSTAVTNAGNKIVSMTLLIPEQCRSIEGPAGCDRQLFSVPYPLIARKHATRKLLSLDCLGAGASVGQMACLFPVYDRLEETLQ